MFEHFRVPALHVAEAATLAAYAYGTTTALVIDLGHSSVQIVPIVDGTVLEAHVRRAMHLSGARETERIVAALAEHAAPAARDAPTAHCGRARAQIIAGVIKERLSSCPPSADDFANVQEVLEAVEGFVGAPDADPEAPSAAGGRPRDGGQALPLALQRELVRAGEALFRPVQVLGDNDGSILGVHELAAQVVARCGADNRRPLLSNVCLAGGVATMPGLAARLESELAASLPFCAEYVRVHAAEARYAAWVGGALLASLEQFQEKWLFADEWADARALQPQS